MAQAIALASLLAALGFVALFQPWIGALALLAVAAFVVVSVVRTQASVEKSEPGAVTGRSEETSARAVLEALPEPVFLLDRALSHRFSNGAARNAFGALPPGDPIALRFRSPDMLGAAEEALASGEVRELPYGERGAEPRFYALSILPLRGTDGTVRTLLLHFRDRTGERQAERMRTDFVANASHELRTPLASIIGFIETLEGPAKDDPRARDRFLAIMREQAGRMSRLIDDLLSLSRIEQRPRVMPGEHVDLAEVLRTAQRDLQQKAAEAGVVLELEGVEAPVIAQGDFDELVQVFANLAENACRYGAEGGRVVLGLRSAGAREVEAYVRDWGPGIEARHIPRLTERFYRVEEGKLTKGTGLGLSIVRNILQRHHTRLAVRSRPGKGSTFSARFHRAENDMKMKGEEKQEDELSQN